MAKTLLLADDSVTIQKVVGISFASEDVTLVTVDNGDDAVARAQELRPDVILADVVMPGKNGYEVCEAVKSDPNLSHIPVLLLTGTFEAFDEDRASRAGAAGHIAKPFEAQALVSRVQELLAATPPAPSASITAPVSEPVADAPVAAAGDDAFDFFDDDADPFSDEEEPIVTAEPEAVPNLDIDGPDAAFAFGGGSPTSEEISFEEPAGSPEIAEHTVALLTEDEPEPSAALDAVIGADEFAAFDADEPLEVSHLDADAGNDTAPEPLAPLDGPVASDDFDFDLDDSPVGDDALLRVDSDDLAQATVLDPVGSDGYDVSSSDLGDPLAAGPEIEPVASMEFDAPQEPFAEPEPMPAPLVAEPEPMAVTFSEPALEAVSVEDLAAKSLEQIAPQLREQLHDTLEKVAWESFNDVTEKIVRQALERVEAIAWEVIPQMAETLVREEIRRLKGEHRD